MSYINLQNVTINSFNEICRTCSTKYDLKQLYDNIEIISMLETCTQMQFNKNDELPNKICENCILKLHDAFNFINTCKIVDEAFRKCLTDNFDVKHNLSEQNDPQSCSKHPIHECYIKEEYNINDKKTEDDKSNDATIVENKLNNRKGYECDVCNKVVRHPSHLIIHKRTHSGERPYTCDVCLKAFKDTSHLRRHKRIHSSEKPYKCVTCNKSFNQSNHLKDHEKIHSITKTHKCEICRKTFTLLQHLKRHKQTHLSDVPTLKH